MLCELELVTECQDWDQCDSHVNVKVCCLPKTDVLTNVEFDAIDHRCDCRDNPAVAESLQIYKREVMSKTHKMPVPNILSIDSRCRREICSFETIGIGRTKM